MSIMVRVSFRLPSRRTCFRLALCLLVLASPVSVLSQSAEQPGLARAIGIDEARDGNEERVGIDQEDATRARELGGHGRKIPVADGARALRHPTSSVDYAYASA